MRRPALLEYCGLAILVVAILFAVWRGKDRTVPSDPGTQNTTAHNDPRRDKKSGHVEKKYRQVVDWEYLTKEKWEQGSGFSEGLAAVKRDRKWGFMNRNGRVVIDPAWDEVMMSGWLDSPNDP